jgi:hypothetical protein
MDQKERNRLYYAANKERILARQKERYQERMSDPEYREQYLEKMRAKAKEKIDAYREYRRKWRAHNEDQVREQTMRWRAENLDKYRAYQREYMRMYRVRVKLAKQAETPEQTTERKLENLLKRYHQQ